MLLVFKLENHDELIEIYLRHVFVHPLNQSNTHSLRLLMALQWNMKEENQSLEIHNDFFSYYIMRHKINLT